MVSEGLSDTDGINYILQYIQIGKLLNGKL